MKEMKDEKARRMENGEWRMENGERRKKGRGRNWKNTLQDEYGPI